MSAAHTDAGLDTRCGTHGAEHHSKVCGPSDAGPVKLCTSFVNRQLIDEQNAIRAKKAHKKTAVPHRVQNATTPIDGDRYAWVMGIHT